MGAFTQGGAIQRAGIVTNTAALSGEIGERIYLSQTAANKVLLPSGVATAIVSIVPPIGWWKMTHTVWLWLDPSATIGKTQIYNWLVNAAAIGAQKIYPFAYTAGVAAEQMSLQVKSTQKYFDGVETLQTKATVTSTGNVYAFSSITLERIR